MIVNSIICAFLMSCLTGFIKSDSKTLRLPFGEVDPYVLTVKGELLNDKFGWEAFNNKEIINIENCDFNQKALKDSKFASISASMTISLTILSSNLLPKESFNFSGWDNLKMLTIKDSPLKEMEWSQIKLEQLWYLDLRENYFEEINPTIFSALPILRVLKLDDNNIKTINWKVLKPLVLSPILKEFSLTGNVFCATKDFLHFYEEILNEKDINCPNFFRYSITNIFCKDVRPLHNLDPPKAKCSNMLKAENSISYDDGLCAAYNRVRDKKGPKTN